MKYRICRLVLTTFLLVISTLAFAQSSANYQITTNSSASLLTDKYGNAINLAASPNLVPNGSGAVNSALQPIGFDFIFMGRLYTHLIASSRGVIGLGVSNSPANIIPVTATNDLTRVTLYPPTSTNSAAVVAPFWANWRTDISGPTIRKTLTGTYPNRCLVVQWNVMTGTAASTGEADAEFQCRLYEGSGEIEYVYGKMTIAAGLASTRTSIGFANGATDNSFIAIKDLGSFDATRLASEEPATQILLPATTPGNITGLHTTTAGSQRRISFVPTAANGTISNSFVSDVYSSSMKLNWTSSITNTFGYLLYHSVGDSNNYERVAILPPSTTSYSANPVEGNKRHYWKLLPYTEGNRSDITVLTDSTSCQMAGTYNVGPSGDFPTIQRAYDSLRIKGIKGDVIFELMAGYNFASETFPILLKGLPGCHEANNKITIRPAANASFNYVHPTGPRPVFLLDSVKNLTIDGRAGGTGNSALTLEGAGTLMYIKNVWNNTFQYLNFKSSENENNPGSILTFEVMNADSRNNLITDCNFSSRGAPYQDPRGFIFVYMRQVAEFRLNTIKRCNFSGFSADALALNGKGWTIDSNSFYSFSPDFVMQGSFITLYTRDNTMTSRITNNYFGGTAPECGGFMTTKKFGLYFWGISTASSSYISNNHFKKIRIHGDVGGNTSLVQAFMIQTGVASTDMPLTDTVINNHFGDATAEDALFFTNTNSGVLWTKLIYTTNSGSTLIENNSLVNITADRWGTGRSGLTMIESAAGEATIRNNIIGTNDHRYRVKNIGFDEFSGIVGKGKTEITGNTITNIITNRKTRGINVTGTGAVVKDNTISHLIQTQILIQDDLFSLAGIAAINAPGVQIEHNRIIHLEDSTLMNTNGVKAIYANKTNGGIITRNLIDALKQLPQATATKSLIALAMEESGCTISNNMIRLGLDTAGNTVDRGVFLAYTNNSVAPDKFIHNTVYIAGTNAGTYGGGGSYMLYWNAATQFYNNIFVNQRTYVTGFADPNASAIYFTGANEKPTTLNYNLYYHSPAIKFTNQQHSFQSWKANFGRDTNSLFFPPNFVSADGPSRTLDLHITGVSAAERTGTALQTTTLDFDGDVRADYTPTDIGADAANNIPRDFAAPVFTFTPLANATDTTGRIITVTISDTLSGMMTTGNTRPAIWYRKKFPEITPWQYSFGSLENGTNKTGDWQFYIDHQALNVSEFGRDSIEYYFVAQDTVTDPKLNISILPAQGAVHTNVSTQVTAPSKPYVYEIMIPYIIPSIVEVGQGKKYSSLTRNGGFFEGLQRDSVNADITVRITSHLKENGKWLLDSALSAKNIHIRIEPSHDSLFIISNDGNITGDMIRINGFDGLTIDGSYNGAGRWLRFVNATASPALTKATISLFGGIDTINILNTELQSNSNGSIRMGVLFIGSGYKKEINLRNNKFSNSTTSAAKPASAITTDLVYSSLTRVNNMTIVGNHFVNIDNAVIWWEGFLDSARIDSNHVYWNDAQPHHGRQFQGFKVNGNEASFRVRYNYIGGSEPYCGGSPWITDGLQAGFIGIHTYTPQSKDSSYIEYNVLKNIRSITPSSGHFSGILGGGLCNIRYNIVGDSLNNQSLVIANDGMTAINVGDKKGIVSNNLVSGIERRGGPTASFTGISVLSDSTKIVRNNIVSNISIMTTATNNNYFYGIRIVSRVSEFVVEQNEIFNISSSGASQMPTLVGIEAAGLYDLGGFIRRNRIYNFSIQNPAGGKIYGISFQQTGSWKVENNQLSLTNGTSTVPVTIYGIYDDINLTTPCRSSYDFNSILIGGTQTSGNSSSYIFNKPANGTTTRFKNNLLINERTGGSGVQGIIAVNKHTEWLPGIMDYNMLIVKDSSTAVLLQNNQVASLTSWKQNTKSEQNGFIAVTDSISGSQLFEDQTKGNLNIKTDYEKSWYVNGNGLPLADIDADYNQTGIRSISIANGPVDIGSHEFTPIVAPPALIVNGSHTPGGTETFSMNGRTVATINWSQQGELPTLGNVRFYSGIWPNDTTNNNTVHNARSWSAYLQIPATGGNGYRYDLTLHYDSSMLGKVQDASTMVINKREIGTPGSWQVINPTQVNTSGMTLKLTNQESFSEFTATDTLATFAAPPPPPAPADLVITAVTATPGSIPTAGSFTVNFTERNTGDFDVAAHEVYFYLSADATLTPGSNGDLLLGKTVITDGLKANTSTANLSKTLEISCTITPGIYSLFIVADGGNVITEADESNNSMRVDISVTTGITMPGTPVITASPAASVCSPSTVTLNASVAECSTCTYSWSNGSSGNSIVVNESGTYSVTVTNICGSTTQSQLVTITQQTATPVITLVNNNLVSSSPTGNSWYLNGNILPGATGNTYTPLASGNYTVIANTTGCPSIASAVHAYIATSVNSPDLENKLRIGPNPADRELNISYKGNTSQFMLVITDLAGREVLSRLRFTNNITIDMSSLSTGSYVVSVYNLTKKEMVRKIVLKY